MAKETEPKAEEVAAEKAPAVSAAAGDAKEQPKATPEEVDVSAAGMPQSVAFKEESNLVADLPDSEKKALDEFKQLITSAIAKKEFNPPPPPPPAAAKEEPKAEHAKEEVTKPEEAKGKEPIPPESAPEPPKPAEDSKKEAVTESDPKPPPTEEEKPAAAAESVEPTTTTPPAATPEEAAPEEEDVLIWGVPIVGEEKSHTILLKFLRARDFKVKESLKMLKNTVIWRKKFGIEPLLAEDLGLPSEMNKVVFMRGEDKEGHPVCYNVYGEFQDSELYGKVFGDEDKRQKFLRWRIQFLEKGIRELLDFSPGAVSTMVQVNDLKNFTVAGKRNLRQTINQALALLQDNYPEFVAKQVFINVPWWYLAYNKMISPFLTQRTKSKFVFSAPSRSTDTLFKYIAPEQVPVQYGGLSQENDPDFTAADIATDITIKPSIKHTVEIPVTSASLLVWELRVLGWDVTYSAEFVPSAEGGYTVIVQKARKMVATDEPTVKNTFKTGEAGKIILTIDNLTARKKKLLYRSKAKSSTESV